MRSINQSIAIFLVPNENPSPGPKNRTLPGHPYKVHKPLRRFPRGYMMSALRNKPTVMPIAI